MKLRNLTLPLVLILVLVSIAFFWNPKLSHLKGVLDDKNLVVTETHLVVRFNLPEYWDFDDDNQHKEAYFLVDTDNNPETGFQTNGLGVDLTITTNLYKSGFTFKVNPQGDPNADASLVSEERLFGTSSWRILEIDRRALGSELDFQDPKLLIQFDLKLD